jgi:hypothetical protein
MKKMLGALIFVLALFAVCDAVQASTPTVPTVAVQPGCQPVLDLGKALAFKGETCPALAVLKAQTLPAPDFLIGGRTRTCRCSCGYPCTTDADCGGAVGSCRVGITCC